MGDRKTQDSLDLAFAELELWARVYIDSTTTSTKLQYTTIVVLQTTSPA